MFRTDKMVRRLDTYHSFAHESNSIFINIHLICEAWMLRRRMSTSGIALNNEGHVHTPGMHSTDLGGHMYFTMENKTQSSGVSGPV